MTRIKGTIITKQDIYIKVLHDYLDQILFLMDF
jgi:hypothetical protein